MMRYFRIALGALAMLVVAMASCLITMRLAVHGREVEVPNFSGMTLAEASDAAEHKGLELSLEDRFYSTVVPSGRVMQQFPAAGVHVRREWQVRITESMGPQRVSIPDVVGQPEREASVAIRRASLELGTIAYAESPGPAGIVLAQTPPANAEGVDRPRVSILLSEPESAAKPEYKSGTEDGQNAEAKPNIFVMPSFIGLSSMAATSRALSAGLRVAYLQETSAAASTATASTTATPAPATTAPTDTPAQSPGAPPAAGAAAPSEPIIPAGVVSAQLPQTGHRTQRGDTIRLTLR
jgi:beta-lactam-binding protein with PASTA domain